MEYKGGLKGFPTEIVEKMLERQVEQGNLKNVSIFENNKIALRMDKGFDWVKSPEGQDFWLEVIECENFDLFFKKYPKKKELTFPRKMLVWNDPKNKQVELVFGIFPSRISEFKVIGNVFVYKYAEEIQENQKDPLLKKLEKLETELQTLKNEIKSRTA